MQANFEALATKQGPSFRDIFAANLMTNFTDARMPPNCEFRAGAGDLRRRVMTARALETIAISADLKARALPAIDAWIRDHK